MQSLKVKPKQFEAMFGGLNVKHLPRFPHWMHKDGAEPVLVNSEKEELEAIANGYDNITSGAMANRYLVNWFWDLEDMSAKQLHVFALEEYGVDLPIEAGQDKLFQLVCRLSRSAPQSQNRMVLMAHTVQMNYDATLDEIRRMMTPGANGVASEVTTMEFEA